MKMPLYIKIDFRANSRLGAWHSRDVPYSGEWGKLNSDIDETSIRAVLLALADEIDPEPATPSLEKEGDINE